MSFDTKIKLSSSFTTSAHARSQCKVPIEKTMGSIGSAPLHIPPAMTRVSTLTRHKPGTQKGMESSHKGLQSGQPGDAAALPDGQARSFLQGQAIIRHGEKP